MRGGESWRNGDRSLKAVTMRSWGDAVQPADSHTSQQGWAFALCGFGLALRVQVGSCEIPITPPDISKTFTPVLRASKTPGQQQETSRLKARSPPRADLLGILRTFDLDLHVAVLQRFRIVPPVQAGVVAI